MYKVVLVDDEIWSLEGLEASFEWEINGFQVVGKFTDSLKAAARIMEIKPDVVFTDIRMPDMTGLELMERVRSQNRDVEFVMVSGYAEFDYARQAVRQGACDYLLKPVDLEETDAILERLHQMLKYRKEAADEILIQRILYEGQEEEKLLPIAGCRKVQAAVILGDEMKASVCRQIQKYLQEENRKYVLLIPAGKKIVLLYEAFEDEKTEGWIRYLEGLGENFYIGLSQTGEGGDARLLLKEAIAASSGKFIGKQLEMHKGYNENFMRLLEYVEENYTKKLNLKTLSEQFFLNVSYCSELFKKVTGMNFSDYLTRLRMEKAAKLLSTGKYKVREVAEMTGYSDAFYFSKVLKKYFGVTPARFFKEQEREETGDGEERSGEESE